MDGNQEAATIGRARRCKGADSAAATVAVCERAHELCGLGPVAMNLRVTSKISGPLKATYHNAFQSVTRVRAATEISLPCAEPR